MFLTLIVADEGVFISEFAIADLAEMRKLLGIILFLPGSVPSLHKPIIPQPVEFILDLLFNFTGIQEGVDSEIKVTKVIQ